MPFNLFAVFSQNPGGVSWDEYSRWSDEHVRENILTPGFRSATRYQVETVVAGRRTRPGEFEMSEDRVIHNHLSLYEFEGDLAVVRGNLLKRVEGGDIVLPPWFDQVSFLSFGCTPITERIEAT